MDDEGKEMQAELGEVCKSAASEWCISISDQSMTSLTRSGDGPVGIPCAFGPAHLPGVGWGSTLRYPPPLQSKECSSDESQGYGFHR